MHRTKSVTQALWSSYTLLRNSRHEVSAFFAALPSGTDSGAVRTGKETATDKQQIRLRIHPPGLIKTFLFVDLADLTCSVEASGTRSSGYDCRL